MLGGYQKSGAFPDLDSKSSRSWVQFRFSAIRFQFSGFEYVMDKSEVLLHTSGKLEKPPEIGNANQNRVCSCRKWGAPHLPLPPGTPVIDIAAFHNGIHSKWHFCLMFLP